jgi:hypothetical protein
VDPLVIGDGKKSIENHAIGLVAIGKGGKTLAKAGEAQRGKGIFIISEESSGENGMNVMNVMNVNPEMAVKQLRLGRERMSLRSNISLSWWMNVFSISKALALDQLDFLLTLLLAMGGIAKLFFGPQLLLQKRFVPRKHWTAGHQYTQKKIPKKKQAGAFGMFSGWLVQLACGCNCFFNYFAGVMC